MIEQLNKIINLMENIDNSLYLLNEATLSIPEIYEKYYNKIPENTFNNIIKSDPTTNFENSKMGIYSKWLLNLYRKGNIKEEDLYKAKQYLEIFNTFKNKIKDRDINHYLNIQELFKTIEPFYKNPEQATSKSDEIRKLKEGAEKWYEDDEWLVIIPHTRETSCFYGKGTQWCTAAEHSDNYFNHYNAQGPLYININKKNGKKYQFHFESEQFMDETDSSVSIFNVGLTKPLLKRYMEKLSEKVDNKTKQEKRLLTSDKNIMSLSEYMSLQNNDDITIIGIVWDLKNKKAFSLGQTYCQWADDDKDSINSGLPQIKERNETFKDRSGKLNTEYLVSKSGYPAANWCNEYSTPGTNKGEWYLMTVSEWQDAIKNMDEWFGIAQVFGWSNRWFWTSSECSESSSWCAGLDLKGVYEDYKTNGNCVRACLAF